MTVADELTWLLRGRPVLTAALSTGWCEPPWVSVRALRIHRPDLAAPFPDEVLIAAASPRPPGRCRYDLVPGRLSAVSPVLWSVMGPACGPCGDRWRDEVEDHRRRRDAEHLDRLTAGGSLMSMSMAGPS